MALWNFSWVIPGKLAGTSRPGGYRVDVDEYVLADLGELYQKGVRVLISLNPMAPVFGELCEKARLQWGYFPIDDFSVPADRTAFDTLVESSIDHMQNNRPVCVHCQAGIGRTGLLLTCIIGRFHKLDARKALEAVRKRRLALDTEHQETFVYEFLDGTTK